MSLENCYHCDRPQEKSKPFECVFCPVCVRWFSWFPPEVCGEEPGARHELKEPLDLSDTEYLEALKACESIA